MPDVVVTNRFLQLRLLLPISWPTLDHSKVHATHRDADPLVQTNRSNSDLDQELRDSASNMRHLSVLTNVSEPEGLEDGKGGWLYQVYALQ
jgi:hypothetical protein